MPDAALKAATSYLLVMSEKEQSKSIASTSRRFKLPKSRILRGRRNFQKIFSDSLIIHSPSVTLRYSLYPNSSKDFKIGFIAPKKTGTAVQRNRTKRLLREAFRLQQQNLLSMLDETNLEVHAVLIARTTDVDFHTIQQQVETLLKELRNRLLSNTNLAN